MLEWLKAILGDSYTEEIDKKISTEIGKGFVSKTDCRKADTAGGYVEYGHRTRDHKGWVPGHFMLTISEQEVQEIAPKLLEAKIKKYLRECLG